MKRANEAKIQSQKMKKRSLKTQINNGFITTRHSFSILPAIASNSKKPRYKKNLDAINT